jgi:peptidyl-prolyl cis-trans isomerase SurA
MMAKPRCLPLARACAVAFVLVLVVAAAPQAFAQSSIKVLVNDEPITSFDIQQRTTMLKVFSRGAQGEKLAIEQLIDEVLMLQEAERRNMQVTDAEVDDEFANRARSANLSAQQFSQAMRQSGFDPQTFKNFLRANMAWRKIVRARFSASANVTDLDVAAALTNREPAEGEGTGETQLVYEYMLQPILFLVPAGSGVEGERRNQAEAFRSAFTGCDNSLQQAAGTPGIVVKPQIRREHGQMSPTLAKSIEGLDVGGITAPERVAEGIQIIAICRKTEIAGQTEAAVEVRQELTTERGDLMARRYLRDLRSDASIEYR